MLKKLTWKNCLKAAVIAPLALPLLVLNALAYAVYQISDDIVQGLEKWVQND